MSNKESLKMWQYEFFGVKVTCLPFGNFTDDKIKQIFSIRKNSFIDRRRWKMDSYDGTTLETDQYDNENSYYLYHENGRNIDGCVRLIPSNRPTLLCGALEYVTGGERVDFNQEYICWEASRFCLKPCFEDKNISKRKACVRAHAMFMGMIFFGIDFGIQDYEIVVDEPMRRVLNMCGWPLSIISDSKGSRGESVYYGALNCNQACQERIKLKALMKMDRCSCDAAV
jgi:N-acyl-L-homoserine lactone synthetase